jgi:3-carboxy-cis,cis-muconate cycloisomerase
MRPENERVTVISVNCSMSVSPFDHPFLSGFLGDAEIAAQFSAEADIKAMIAFELSLAEVESDKGLIPTSAATAIASTLAHFVPDIEKLREAAARDGVIVPELVSQMRVTVGQPHGEYLHLGATSQDVIDTSLTMRLKIVLGILTRRLDDVASALTDLDRKFGSSLLLAHTRMQPAMDITVSDRIRSWREPLARHQDRLAAIADQVAVVQFGGAAGTLEKLGGKGAEVRKALAGKLGLADIPQWHSQRDRLVDFAGLLSLIAGSLGKIGQDIALLAQAGVEIELTRGGGSSAMANKKNPVAAEVLVTLARFNATQLAGMHGALMHEQERSGASWTLEWLLLPQMAVAAGAALHNAGQLIANVDRIGR